MTVPSSCGREYGTQSLKIHLPQCQKLWLERESLKPKNERRALPAPPPQFTSRGSFNTRRSPFYRPPCMHARTSPLYSHTQAHTHTHTHTHTRSLSHTHTLSHTCTGSSQSRAEQNEEAFKAYNDKALLPCQNCGRTFLEDR